MQYRKILFPLMVVLSVMVFVGISPAFALCPPDKVPVTIVNPAGKVLELCVPANVVDKIGGGEAIVIPAQCPCYSQDDLDAIWTAQPFQCYMKTGVTKLSNSPCAFVKCVYPLEASPGEVEVDLLGWEGIPLDGNMEGDSCSLSPSSSGWPFIASKDPTGNGCYAYVTEERDYPELTEAQGKACVEILKTFLSSP